MSSGITDDRNDPGLRNIGPDGQQEKYLVLSADERAKDYVRPLRTAYKHVACGGETSMSAAIAATYARDPSFYSGTFCAHCGGHFPLKDEAGQANFTWAVDGTPVGS